MDSDFIQRRDATRRVNQYLSADAFEEITQNLLEQGVSVGDAASMALHVLQDIYRSHHSDLKEADERFADLMRDHVTENLDGTELFEAIYKEPQK